MPRGRAGLACALGVALAGLSVAATASAQTPPPDAPPTTVAPTTTTVPVVAAVEPPQRAFEPVFEGVVDGDLLLVGNSSLLTAGSLEPTADDVADVDGDATTLCATRLFVPGGCSDNSSSADLALPAGARVVAARLYVNTTLARNATSAVARIDGPAEGYAYTDLGPTTAGIPKLWEATGTGMAGSMMRQAVWDVTAYVQANGPGAYTVADIVNDPGLAEMPYASWAMAVLYQYDTSTNVALTSLPPATQQLFTSRSIAWHDGFVVQTDGALDVELRVSVPTPAVPFAKSYHVVAHGGTGAFDNLLLNDRPLGNSATPGNAPAPAGVVVGDDVACNDITDIFNDSVCLLGSHVATKAPGATDFTASTGSGAATSGSGVDIDITRIPDRYLEAGAIDARLSILSRHDRVLAPGLLAVSIDLADPPIDPDAAVDSTAPEAAAP